PALPQRPGAPPRVGSAPGAGRVTGVELLLSLRDLCLHLGQPVAFLGAALLGLGDLLLAVVEPGQQRLAPLDLGEMLMSLDCSRSDGFSLRGNFSPELLQLSVAFAERVRILLELLRSRGLRRLELRAPG